MNNELKQKYPNQKDFFVVPSIKRYCKKHNISRRMNRQYLELIVQELVSEAKQFHKNLSEIFVKFISQLLQYNLYTPHRTKLLHKDIFPEENTENDNRQLSKICGIYLGTNWEIYCNFPDLICAS